MSENVSIQESKQSRMFGGVDRIETETADGEGSCFWVPARERELESGFFMKNGDYTPEKYAFSDITVNVVDFSTDFEGINWTITIDDFGLPHIRIPDQDIDITIDPINGIPDINIDDQQITLPDIDGLLDFNADFDISLDGMDLNISGVDLDGLDLDVSINLDTLDIELTELPDEIRIITPPIKTEYKDGEKIDLNGIEVQPFRDGKPWFHERHVNVKGYIPPHKLIVDPNIASFDKEKVPYYEMSGAKFYKNIHYEKRGLLDYLFYVTFRVNLSGALIFPYLRNNYIRMICYGLENESIVANGELYEKYVELSGTTEETKPIKLVANEDMYFSKDTTFFPRGVLFGAKDFWTDLTGWKGLNYQKWVPDKAEWEKNSAIYGNNASTQGSVHTAAYRILTDATAKMKTDGVITVSWPRPKDNKLLTASFDITVEEAGTGTHHSGTWGDDESGHWGGTTIGEGGGSHYSGKF